MAGLIVWRDKDWQPSTDPGKDAFYCIAYYSEAYWDARLAGLIPPEKPTLPGNCAGLYAGPLPRELMNTPGKLVWYVDRWERDARGNGEGRIYAIEHNTEAYRAGVKCGLIKGPVPGRREFLFKHPAAQKMGARGYVSLRGESCAVIGSDAYRMLRDEKYLKAYRVKDGVTDENHSDILREIAKLSEEDVPPGLVIEHEFDRYTVTASQWELGTGVLADRSVPRFYRSPIISPHEVTLSCPEVANYGVGFHGREAGILGLAPGDVWRVLTVFEGHAADHRCQWASLNAAPSPPLTRSPECQQCARHNLLQRELAARTQNAAWRNNNWQEGESPSCQPFRTPGSGFVYAVGRMPATSRNLSSGMVSRISAVV